MNYQFLISTTLRWLLSTSIAIALIVLLIQLVGPYMDVSRKARFGDVKFQRACSLTYGLLLQAFHPAGPDGIRGQGSHLKFEFKTLGDYRIVPAPV